MRTIAAPLIAVLLTVSIGTIAQSPPAPAAPPEPAAGDQLRAAMADLKAELAATRAETKALMVDREKQKNAQLQRAIAREKRRQARLATLAVEHGEVQIEMKQADQQTLEALRLRNAQLENKIKKANRTFACRVLHIGCVSKP